MDHTEAVRTEAAERYLLGQLSGSEHDEFETHFFDCAECAQELRAGALFEENAKVIFDEERAAQMLDRSAGSPTTRRSPWVLIWGNPWSAAPALAALALSAVTAYQTMIVIPGLRTQLSEGMSPQPVVSYVLPSASRGDARVVEVPAGSRFYTIYADPAWEGSFAAYMLSVRDESGSTRLSLRLPPPPPGKPIEILMTKSFLPSGRYTVVIRNVAEAGKPEAELARYALILKLD